MCGAFPFCPTAQPRSALLWFYSGFYLCCCLNAGPWVSTPTLSCLRGTLVPSAVPRTGIPAEGHPRSSRICPMFQLAVGIESARNFSLEGREPSPGTLPRNPPLSLWLWGCTGNPVLDAVAVELLEAAEGDVILFIIPCRKSEIHPLHHPL